MLKREAMALVLVLFVLFSVLAVAQVVIIFFYSQSRLSHHQISRIQAYYAGMAGINYAFEQLRQGNWTEGTYYLDDPQFPHVIKDRKVQIEIESLQPSSGQRKVTVKVRYTSPP